MHMLRSIGWLTMLRHFFTFLSSSVGSKFSVLTCFFLHFGRQDFPENVLPTDESSIFQLTSGNCLHHQAALFLLKNCAIFIFVGPVVFYPTECRHSGQQVHGAMCDVAYVLRRDGTEPEPDPQDFLTWLDEMEVFIGMRALLYLDTWFVVISVTEDAR